MGSERDLEFCREIAKYLKLLGVEYAFRVASAHKTPEQVLAILRREFVTIMRQMGTRALAEIGREHVRLPDRVTERPTPPPLVAPGGQ